MVDPNKYKDEVQIFIYIYIYIYIYVFLCRFPDFSFSPSFAQENGVPLASFELTEKFIEPISAIQTSCVFCIPPKDVSE